MDANQTTLHLDKAQVLATLRKIESKDVNPEVVQSRIKHLNKAFIAIGRDVYDTEEAVLTISFRKDSIVLKLLPVMVRSWKDCKDDKADRFLSMLSMFIHVIVSIFKKVSH